MRLIPVTTAIAAALALSACGTTPAPGAARPAATATPGSVPSTSTARSGTANLASASGSMVSGKVTLTPMGDGVHITGTVGGLPPNSSHGFHVHEKGDCSAADATSAGDHFNPFGNPHGNPEGAAHHAGDMRNISTNAEGVATIDVHASGVTLGGGAVNDIASRAVIVHAGADDYSSQPAGAAGARVACGVIRTST